MKKSTRKKDLSRDLARQITQSAYDVKGENLVVLDLRELSGFTDYFVVASGRSDRQVQAIANRVQEDLKKKGLRPLSIEGYTQGHWILVDFGSVVAHLFFTETRDFYGIEKLWSDAPQIHFRLK